MKQEMDHKKIRIGDALIAAGLVSEYQIDIIAQKQLITGEKFGELFLRMGIVSEYDIARLLGEQRSLAFSNVDEEPAPEAEILDLFNQEFCLSRAFLPLRREGNELIVVAGNVDYDEVEQAINQRTGLRCLILQGEFSKVLRAIRYYYYFASHPVQELCLKESRRLEKDVDQVLTPDALLNHLFHLAVQQRATDIHIQPELKSFHIFFRIDGVLRPVFAFSRKLQRLVASIKMQAGMDISDNIRPQDGSFSIAIIDMPFDIRVSTLITEFGENIVLRLLPGGMQVSGLKQLGFFKKDLVLIDKLFANPYGILLMTGPTGAGKSTTLHSGLRVSSMDSKNILTVEDPIEYKLPLACQTQVNRKAGYFFDTAITHFLRHDPDVILLGEIRDTETAQAAITAAETGHLVLSTLHVNTMLGVLSRFQALNIPSQMLADSLIGVINQRLVRKICSFCRESYVPDEKERRYLQGVSADVLYRGRGCKHCLGTGYFGRTPVYEVLSINAELSEMIAAKCSCAEIEKVIAASDFVPIEKMGLQLVIQGDTSLDELKRQLGRTMEGLIR